jgi:hypothetical protein
MMGDQPSNCVSSSINTNTLQQTHYVSNDSIKESEQHKQISITTTSTFAGSSTLVQTASSVDSIIGQQQHEIAIDSSNFPDDLSGLNSVDLAAITGRTQSSVGANCNTKMEYYGFAPSSIPTPASANGHHPQHQHAAHSQQHLQQQFNGPGSAPAGPSCCSSADSGHHSASGSISCGTGGDFFRRPSSSSSNVLNQSHYQQNFDHLRLNQQSLIKVNLCLFYCWELICLGTRPVCTRASSNILFSIFKPFAFKYSSTAASRSSELAATFIAATSMGWKASN